ncbi:DNA gyrase subunit B [Streptomyces sp. NPDC098781]|uniref:DNA gyrase subunit B n=1 Tax=Streptomyces sp. NPDC098781 TaxID=3366097 RepID=UPI00381C2158
MSDDAIRYDAGHIQVLEGREAVRKRPGMYVGSTGERGLRQLVFDVADRAVNEVLVGRASRVEVTLTADGGVRIADDGPGDPFEDTGTAGAPGLETLLTRIQTGVQPAGRHDVALGYCGMGPFVTNALSSRLTAEVRREGVSRVQEYSRGIAVTPTTRSGPATGTGTTITFWPDAEIFGTATYSFDGLEERFRELAFLNRELDISLTDRRRPVEARTVRFRFPGGARDFVAFLDERAGAPVHPDVIALGWEDRRIAGTVEVALRWCHSREQRIRSYANCRPTLHGSTHETGFWEGLTAAIDAYAREQRLLAASDAPLGTDRIGEGLTAVVSVKLDQPEFHGATRSVLGGTGVRECVAQAVQEHLDSWLASHPEQAAAIIDRISGSSAAPVATGM